MAGEKILIVDDESGVRNALTSILKDEGYAADSVDSGEACLETLKRTNYQAILLDIWLPGMDGIETLKAIKNIGTESAIIMISGHGTIETAVKATKLGAFDFIEKPLSLEKTVLVLKNALRHKKLLEKHKILEEELKKDMTLIGSSEVISRIREDIKRAAPSDAPLLITGEHGSGKELVARMIHFSSPRSREAFIALNCAALEKETLNQELFGYEQGSFSWAMKGKKGKLGMAHEGTLFLNNIDRMSRQTQFKIFHVLEDKFYEPCGSEKRIRTNVRIISASEDPLKKAVERGAFLKEAFFKLSVITLQIPPLRERTEDIPMLAKYFLHRFSLEYGKKPKVLSREAAANLTSYRWPGNVRELKNIMERVVIMVQEEVIEERHLSPILRSSAMVKKGKGRRARFQPLHKALHAFEKRYIEKVMRQVGRNKEEASKILELDRASLENRMKLLGLEDANLLDKEN